MEHNAATQFRIVPQQHVRMLTWSCTVGMKQYIENGGWHWISHNMKSWTGHTVVICFSNRPTWLEDRVRRGKEEEGFAHADYTGASVVHVLAYCVDFIWGFFKIKFHSWFLSLTNLTHFFLSIPDWHTRQSPTQSDIYQMMY